MKTSEKVRKILTETPHDALCQSKGGLYKKFMHINGACRFSGTDLYISLEKSHYAGLSESKYTEEELDQNWTFIKAVPRPLYIPKEGDLVDILLLGYNLLCKALGKTIKIKK